MESVFNESKKENINIKLIDDGNEAKVYLENIINTKASPNFDLVLIDVKPLEEEGNRLLTLLKTNEITKEIPVLIFSNSNHQNYINTSYRLSANCFLKKPLALKDYVDTIRSIKQFWMNSEVVSLPNKF